MAKVIKQAGLGASAQRHRTVHGTSADHRLSVLAGQDSRDTEKPGGARCREQNRNKTSRGSSRPGRS